MSRTRQPYRRTPPPWYPGFISALSYFDDLRELFNHCLPRQWPDSQVFNALARQRQVTFADGRRLRYIEQQRPLSALAYEQTIASDGRIPMRPGHWHDVFNALMWLSLPRTKSALNRLHVTAGNNNELAPSQPVSANQRTRQRDFATLLDEAGIIMACSNTTAHAYHQQHDWHALFLAHRNQWWQNWRPYIIGHGLYEQCLTPYLGLTAKAFYLNVSPAFFQQPLARQYRELDTLLAQALDNPQRTRPQFLLPLPVLGIPTWWPDNEQTGFYNNHDYFRPRRQR